MLRHMVTAIVINQCCFVHVFPKGIVEIIVVAIKRGTIQNGGTKKLQISKLLIFVSPFLYT